MDSILVSGWVLAHFEIDGAPAFYFETYRQAVTLFPHNAHVFASKEEAENFRDNFGEGKVAKAKAMKLTYSLKEIGHI